jgi:hypothetical protein
VGEVALGELLRESVQPPLQVGQGLGALGEAKLFLRGLRSLRLQTRDGPKVALRLFGLGPELVGLALGVAARGGDFLLFGD